MSRLNELIRREILARRELVGTVLQPLRLVNFDTTVGVTWVTDVDIGGGNFLVNVPVKAGADGTRFYAGLGHSVKLNRNTLGRVDIVGPADKVLSDQQSFKTYSLGVPSAVTAATLGFQFDQVAFEFYQNAAFPGASFWADGVTPFPLVRILDGAGNPV